MAAVADLLVAVSIAAVVGVAWEWRRRRRTHWLQFRLMELLFAMTSVAACLAWFTHQRAAHQAEWEHKYQLEEQDALTGQPYQITLHGEFVAAAWLMRLVGPELLQDSLWRHTSASATFGRGEFGISPSWMLPHLLPLEYLEEFECTGVPSGRDNPFPTLARVPQLRTLRLRLGSGKQQQVLDADQAAKLATMQQITQLELPSRDNLSPEAWAIIERDMPNCRVVFRDDE